MVCSSIQGLSSLFEHNFLADSSKLAGPFLHQPLLPVQHIAMECADQNKLHALELNDVRQIDP